MRAVELFFRQKKRFIIINKWEPDEMPASTFSFRNVR
jgi:hypothetical protein